MPDVNSQEKQYVPLISVIISCYNTGRFLGQSIQSIIDQQFTNWELIIVNDGSTDNSLEIAERYVKLDGRISVRSKKNGGLASARLHGYKFLSPQSRYVIFYDADDMMHPEMLLKLFNRIESDPKIGAVYSNHRLIDPDNNDLGLPTYGKRLVPTTLWVKALDEDVPLTPFISIFCWATKMIEPMTLIRREAYDASRGWHPTHAAPGYIGEGVLLFSEIALTWKVAYINEPLYLYRKHPKQETASADRNAGEQILSMWRQQMKPGDAFSKDIKAATICYKTRMIAFSKWGSLKHTLKHAPLQSIRLSLLIFYKYIQSLQLLFYRDTKVFES